MHITKILSLSLILFLFYIPCIGVSDSGYVIISYDNLSFDQIPRQTGIIFYRNGYEYLMVFTTYEVTSTGNVTDAIFYFPLPSKPLVVEITPVIYGFTLEFNTGVNDVNLATAPYGVLIYTAGAGEELTVYTSGYYNLSLVEARHASIDLFKEVLASKGYHGELPREFINTINYYLELGWKYFVIGVVKLNKTLTLLQQYVFRTDKIVYPLYIDRVNEGKLELSIFIISSETIYRYMDPCSSTVKEAKKMLYGLDLNMRIEYLDYRDYSVLNEALNKVSNTEVFQRIFSSMIKLSSEREYLGLSAKGIIYYYESYIEARDIENDFIAYPSGSRDISFQAIGTPVELANIFWIGFFGIFLVPALLVIVVSSIESLNRGQYSDKKFSKTLIIAYIFYIGVIIVMYIGISTNMYVSIPPLSEPLLTYYPSLFIVHIIASLYLVLIIPYYIVLLRNAPEKILWYFIFTVIAVFPAFPAIIAYPLYVLVTITALITYVKTYDILKPKHKYFLLPIVISMASLALIMIVIGYGIITIA